MDSPALFRISPAYRSDQLLGRTGASKASKQATQDKIPFIYLPRAKQACHATRPGNACAEEFGYPYCDLKRHRLKNRAARFGQREIDSPASSVLPLFNAALVSFSGISRPYQSAGAGVTVQFSSRLMTECGPLLKTTNYNSLIDKFLDSLLAAGGHELTPELDDLDVQTVRDD